MKYIRIDKIMVKANAGTHLLDCIQESLKLATEKWERIILKHNDILYEIDPIIITETIRVYKKIKNEPPEGDE